MISLSLPGSTAAPVLRDCWPDFVRSIDSASPRSARALRGYWRSFPWALPIFGRSDPHLASCLRPTGGRASAGSGRAVLPWSGAKGTTGATLRKARRAIATLGRPTLIDHDNLEEYADPDEYDRQDSSDTGVAFYASLAREAGGTGRVAIPIARQGFAVTGLDVVPAMLERARSKSAGLPTRWIEGDARRFDLGEERFRLIFLTGNAFQAFVTNADQEALLGRVRAHLHDEGLFAFETRNPRWRTREHRDEDPDGLFVYLETRAEEEALPPRTDAHGREVREWRTRAYDHAAQVLHWTSRRRWHEGAKERTKITRTHQQRALFTVRL